MDNKKIKTKHPDTLVTLLNPSSNNLASLEDVIYEPSLKILKKNADVYCMDIGEFIEPDNNGEFTREEQEFMYDLGANTENIFEKYNLLLNSRVIAEEEMDFIIVLILQLLQAVKKD